MVILFFSVTPKYFLHGPSLVLHLSQLHPKAPKSIVSVSDILAWTIIAGSLVLLLHFCIRLASFFRMKSRAQKQIVSGAKILLVKENIKPFSFLGHIFINPAMHPQNELEGIIIHEITHIKQKHIIDLLLSEVLAIMCWFLIPLRWLLLKSKFRLLK